MLCTWNGKQYDIVVLALVFKLIHSGLYGSGVDTFAGVKVFSMELCL